MNLTKVLPRRPLIYPNTLFTVKVEFRMNISDLSGNFEIKEGEAVIVTGKIRKAVKDMLNEFHMSEEIFHELMKEEGGKLLDEKNGSVMLKPEIYKQLRFLGYEYGGLFKGINKCDSSGIISVRSGSYD